MPKHNIKNRLGVCTALAAVVGLTLTIRPAFAGSPQDDQDPAAAAARNQDQVIDATVVAGDDKADEGPKRFEQPVRQAPELVAPIPLPFDPEDLEEAAGEPQDEGVWVRIDKTGRIAIGEAAASPFTHADLIRLRGFAKGLEGEPEQAVPAPENMGSLSTISSTTSFPWSAMVQINSSGGQGSGSLIDPMHVLTAAHVVMNGGTSSVFSGLVVTPGLSGTSTPFDTAGWNSILVWSGWTSSGDFDHDVAVVELDFPIGGRTGWLGYADSSSCSFFQSNTFNIAGYPGSLGGTTMQYQNGDFDSCEIAAWVWFGNEIRFNQPGVPGMSGSPAYHISGSNRYVYSVVSNGDTSAGGHTDCVRLTSSKFSDAATFISGNTPSSSDLVPFTCSGPSSAARGGRVTLNWDLLNHSRVSRSASVSYAVYLSTNDNISTSDTLLAVVGGASTSSWSANEVVARSVTVTIPSTASTGTRWLGVIITSSNSNTANDDTDGVDAHQITIS